ncbi:hypothetical protein QM996_05340 [Sinorhizobium chiapasense]
MLSIALAFLKKGGVVIVIAGAAVLRFFKGLFGRKEPQAHSAGTMTEMD